MGIPSSHWTKPPSDERAGLDASLPGEERRGSGEEVFPLAEEVATVDRREVVTGRVRVQTSTDTVTELAQAQLQHDTVEITRVQVDRVVPSVPEIRSDGEVTIVPVVEEVMVVEKRLILKEELHIRRTRSVQNVEVPVPLRKQRAAIERLSPVDTEGKEESTK
jgi:uncharacterized protein (TIGR02271 family)